MRIDRARSWRVTAVAALLLMASHTASGQSLSPDVRAAVEQAVNAATPADQRIQALTPITAAPAEQRHAALRDIVERGDEQIGCVAAGTLLDEGWLEILPVVGDRVATWSEYGQSVVVSKIRFTPLDGGPALVLPRTLLQHWRDAGAVPAGSNGDPFSIADRAALTLAGSSDVQDLLLLESLLTLDPNRPGFWLARGSMGTLSASLTASASAVVSATSQPSLTRLAAALAVCDQDQSAAAFVNQWFDSYLDRFEAKDAREVLAGSFGQDAAKVQDSKDFRNELLRGLPMLEHCASQSVASGILTRCLAAQNTAIRDLAATAAAIRYPSVLLAGAGNFTQPEYVQLLGVAVMNNQSTDNDARAAVGGAALDAALQTARTNGVRKLFGETAARYYY